MPALQADQRHALCHYVDDVTHIMPALQANQKHKDQWHASHATIRWKPRTILVGRVQCGPVPSIGNPGCTFADMQQQQPDSGPSEFGPELQWEIVREVDNQDECHWSHTCLLQASGRGIDGILEGVNRCRKTRTVRIASSSTWLLRGDWLLGREEHRTHRLLKHLVAKGVGC
jgi:hypothetical protein